MLAAVDFEVLCGHSSAAAGHKELLFWLTNPPLRVSVLDSCGASWTTFLFKDTGSNATTRFDASYGSEIWFGSILTHAVMWASNITYILIYLDGKNKE
jgi:hypothetical protein